MNRTVLALAFASLASCLVFCGGDDAKSTSTTDGGTDGSSSSTKDGSSTNPDTDGSTNPGTDGSTNPGTDPAWVTAPLKSTGCGMAATPSGTNGDAKTVMVGGVQRSYVLYVPKGYDPNKNYPIVMVFHGIGATGPEMAQYIKFQDYSAGNAIVLFPTAVSGTWDTNGDKDLLFFDAMVKTTEDSLCVNERRIFALGFSFGAYMVNHLGCKRSDTLRAFIPADGGFPDAPAGCGKTTVLVYHRTEDDNENIANGKNARDKWLGINGCQSTSKPLNAYGFNDSAVGDTGCVEYDGCPANTTVSWCEDMYASQYKHDLRDVYRIPMWNWFNHF